MEAYSGSECIAPRILNFGTSWRWVYFPRRNMRTDKCDLPIIRLLQRTHKTTWSHLITTISPFAWWSYGPCCKRTLWVILQHFRLLLGWCFLLYKRLL